MLEVEKKLLFVNMEYSQEEVNEPINVDVLLGCFPKELFNKNNVSVVYRDMSEKYCIEPGNYDIILISTKISSFPQLQRILELCTNKIVIIGGILAICAADKLAICYPNVIFSTGEGEANIEGLLRLAYISKTTRELKRIIKEYDIPNIVFFDDDEKILYSTKREICDLSIQESPKHHRITEIIAKNGLIRMETSRGCPWNKCSFCIMPWKYCNEKWRAFSYLKIEKEMEHLAQSGAKQIFFTDEDFVGNYDHIIKICSIIGGINRKYGNKISFGGSTSVLSLLKLGNELEACLQKMQEVGISFLFVGVESGCDSQLLRFSKGVSVIENEKIIKKLREFKFQIDFGFIMFDAYTTMKELEENLDFIQRTGLNNSISRFAKKLRITPHTRCWEEYQKRGLITSDLDINELSYKYNFITPSIDLVCAYMEQMDSQILKESYRLQYILRSTHSLEEKKIARERLLSLRKCGYNFLRKCVEEYKKKESISPAEMYNIYIACLGQGGIFYGDN